MNRADIIDEAIRHAVQPARLHAAALRAATASTWRPAAIDLSAHPTDTVALNAGRLVIGEHGITGFAHSGVQAVHVSWAEVAACLATVVTADLVNDLGHAVHAALGATDPAADQVLHDARAVLADRVATANEAARHSMFADSLNVRTVVERRDDRTGWRCRVSLAPLDPDTVECRVSGHLVAELDATDMPGLVRVSMLSSHLFPAPTLPVGSVRRRLVRLQPPDDPDDPLPPCFADRVGVVVIDYDPYDCFWALQVDGVDVVLLEADIATVAEQLSLQWTVYDHAAIPGLLFERHTGHSTVPSQPPHVGPVDGNAAVDRPGGLRRRFEGPAR